MYCISKSERRQGLRKNKTATKQTDGVRDSKQIWPWIEKQNKLSPEPDWPTTEVKGNELSFSALDMAMMDSGRPRRAAPRALIFGKLIKGMVVVARRHLALARGHERRRCNWPRQLRA
jgi:hypothetical protein